jgi:hypothetical protein
MIKILKYPGILDKLDIMLSHEKPAIRRETCWTLSNFTAGTE